MEESKERHLIFENEVLRSRAEESYRMYEKAQKQEQIWKKICGYVVAACMNCVVLSWIYHRKK